MLNKCFSTEPRPQPLPYLKASLKTSASRTLSMKLCCAAIFYKVEEGGGFNNGAAGIQSPVLGMVVFFPHDTVAIESLVPL